MAAGNKVVIFDLGTVEYDEAFFLQVQLHHMVEKLCCKGFLLLLQHPPVITVGSNRSLKNLVSSREDLKQHNIALIQSNRGGDITFHGPGQLIGYPIVNLDLISRDLSLYVNNLEQIIINTLQKYTIEAQRIKKHRGVFVGNKKIASIGVKIKRWVTMHGFALNISTDLDYFNHIIACGLNDYPPVSMEQILNRCIPISNVKEQITVDFEQVFSTEIVQG